MSDFATLPARFIFRTDKFRTTEPKGSLMKVGVSYAPFPGCFRD